MKTLWCLVCCCCVMLVSMPVIAEEMQVFKPKYEIEQVIQKAKQLVLQQGKHFEEYFVSRVQYDWSKKQWSISFQGDLRRQQSTNQVFIAPGSDAVVLLDETTDKMDFMRGE